MKRIIIIGSRRRDDAVADWLIIESAFLSVFEEDDLLVSGECPKGGDKFAEELSAKYFIPIIIFPADWNKYGKAAGFIRNTDIAKNGDVLIACVAPDRRGGVEDTIKKFKKFNPEGKIILLH